MLMAFKNGRRMTALEAGRGALGTCPWTRLQVKACVGPKTHYWAYEGGQPSLDDGYEIDKAWHLDWKAKVREECCEVIIANNHMVDIFIPGGSVIELQACPMSEETARKRLSYYEDNFEERVVYLLDISDFWRKRFKLGENTGKNKYLVDWSPRRSWIMLLAKSKQCHVYCDFNHDSDKLLKIWGFKKELFASFLSKNDFINEHLGDGLKRI